MKYTLFFIILFLIGCADEKSVSQSVLEACGIPIAQKISIIERAIDTPISIQGYWYYEQAIVELSQSDLAHIEKALEESREYIKNKEFTYESFMVGKHLKLCSINKSTLRLEYSLIYW